jgi:histidine triad (HIT) family protein
MVTEDELQNMSPEEISKLQKSNCIFCKIISGEMKSEKIYEDDKIVAVMDIRPSCKGHVVIMPREHYPILPLVPPETFKHMFDKTKLISKALKKSVLASGFSIFVANGAVAGQQSPHFLFHLMPRDKNDSLKNLFNPDFKEEFVEEQNKIFNSLKNNITIMMNNHLKREGSNVKEEKKEDAEKLKKIAETIEEKREKISLILQENHEARELLRNDVEGFKNLISQNDEIREIFAGVDLIELSNNLKKVDDKIFKPVEENKSEVKPKPEVFLGENPYEQKKIVFEYFDAKPKAKELLMTDLNKFKEILSTRPDVQKIFENVNLDKLSEKLIQAEKITKEEENE